MSHPTLDLCLEVHRVYSGLRLKLDDELGTYHGIAFSDLALLHLLAHAEAGRMKIAELGRPLGLSRSAVLRQLLVLEKIGLVERNGADGDRHAVLRPAGRALTNVASETADRVCSEALASIAPAS
jgi:DNA-binding MarR family transcriptional regulator